MQFDLKIFSIFWPYMCQLQNPNSLIMQNTKCTCLCITDIVGNYYPQCFITQPYIDPSIKSHLCRELTWPAQTRLEALQRMPYDRRWHFSSYSSEWHRWRGKTDWVCVTHQLLEDKETLMLVAGQADALLRVGLSPHPRFKGGAQPK